LRSYIASYVAIVEHKNVLYGSNESCYYILLDCTLSTITI